MATFIKEDSTEKLSKEVHLSPKLTNLMVNKSNYYGEIDPNLQGYKRAKKIANAAEKEQYNTKGKKFTDKGSGVTLNYNEVKRWANALKHLPKNSDAFDANGGEEGKEMVDDLVKQVRRNSQKVDMVPEVSKLVKDLEVSDKPLKPSKIGSADVYVESRKIYINESQLQKLYEDYKQLTIPFDDMYHRVNGEFIPMKYDYEYFIDWLEEIGQKGTLKGNPEYTVEKFFEETWNSDGNAIISRIIDELEDNGAVDYLVDDLARELLYTQYLYDDSFFNVPTEEVENELDNIRYDESLDELYDLLTDLGKKKADAYLKEKIKSRIENDGIYNGNEENGLLYIERVIKLPSITGYSEGENMKMGFNGQATNAVDFYDYLMKNYPSVGICWTWGEGDGDAYESYAGGIKITLKGRVRLEDVDWYDTLYVGGWSLNYENEVRVSQDALVEIDEIIVNDGKLSGKKFPLDEPIIVPA